MKILYTLCLLAFVINSAAQDFKTLSLKRTFKSRDELVKEHPQIERIKLVWSIESLKDRNNPFKKQVSKSAIPENLNACIFSPTKDYFIAYEETEVHTSDLYFYRADGSFLAKQKIDIYPNIKYSNNGEYVIAFNSFGRQILVFSKSGLLLFSGDYAQMTNDASHPLDNVLVSDDGKQILINAGGNAYVFDFKTSKEVFRADVGGWIVDGNFYLSKGKIALKVRSLDFKETKSSFKLISRTDGKIMDQTGYSLDDIQFTSSSVVLSSISSIHEYTFKD